MKNLQRYLYGVLIGMIGEYLFRVEFNIIPLIIMILIIIFAVIDIVQSDFNKQK